MSIVINAVVFRPHRMHDMLPFAIDDPVAQASVCHAGATVAGAGHRRVVTLGKLFTPMCLCH